MQPVALVVPRFVCRSPLRNIETIARKVGDYYLVPYETIVSPCRRAGVARARHVSMYLAKELTRHSFQTIANRLGRDDHTTALHGYRKVAWLIGERDQGFVPDHLTRERAQQIPVDTVLQNDIRVLKQHLAA